MCADINSETLNTPGHNEIMLNYLCNSPVFMAFCVCSSCLQFLRAARGKRKRYSVHLLCSQYLLHAGRLVGYGHPEGHRVHQRKFGGSIWKPKIIQVLMRLFWLHKIRELPGRRCSPLQQSLQGSYPWMDHPAGVGGSVPRNASSVINEGLSSIASKLKLRIFLPCSRRCVFLSAQFFGGLLTFRFGIRVCVLIKAKGKVKSYL